MKTIGINGCRSGWIAISLDEENAGYWLLETQQELEEYFAAYDRIFVDVPIGLEDKNYMRECDELLRNRLGPDYRESVFNPPIRAALHAPTYGEASVITYEATGKKISVEAWNMTPKIKQVDQLLQKRQEFRANVYESYPELLFHILNGDNIILQKKATKKGLRHRLDLLKKESSYVDDFFRDIKEEYRRNQVDEDNIIDAMVLGLFALRAVDAPILSLPSDPSQDTTGLPMAIHYV